MTPNSRARAIAADFAASVLVAAAIGIATSVTLAAAVLLLAQPPVATDPHPAGPASTIEQKAP